MYETEKLPDVTKTEKETEYTTLTKVFPIVSSSRIQSKGHQLTSQQTKTITEEGHTYTVTDVETKTIVTKVPTKVYETEKLPDVTKTEKGVHYETLTTLCPVVGTIRS